MTDKKHISMTFLGTGTSTGIPVVACDCKVCTSEDVRDRRLRTSVMLEINGQHFVIDCGPDFRYQMIREKVEDITAILFTHGHRDHIAGLDDVRAFNYVLNKTVDIYATQGVVDSINKEFPYILKEKRFFGAPQLHFHLIDNQKFTIDGVEFLPIEVMHHKMPVLGFRVQDVTYITDASHISDEEMNKIRGSKVLVINALRKSPHISHFSLDEALQVVKATNPEKAYITHLSHFMGLHEAVQQSLPENVFIAYDGLKVTI
ncbi:MAG: MBL fold metallo-hydrolase [Bacteroidales bacterium]|nr:MBL fold metallo-hydrolase [Bacteroidales bacterium]